jgi:predicted aldo/keto reductase-like oxidoreductase
MERREFLRNVSAAGVPLASASVASHLLAAQGPQRASADRAEPPVGAMPMRTLGRTGEKVSAIGLGGFHIGTQKDEQESIRIIRSAIDGGITFLDNCWDYNDGQSELRMGKALKDGYRDKVFLMTKFDGRTKASAARQIDESLKRLQTDHVDLMQFHEVIRLEDPERFFARDGALEALLDARRAGKVRYVGFTGHKDPLVHLRMLEVAREHDFRFDTVQMPLNVMDAHFRSFAREVLPQLVKDEIGVLGMKPLASGAILTSNTVTARECLHYAMNLPTSVVITGIDSMRFLEQALAAARTFRPMSPEAVAAILSRTAKAAAAGQFERFKTDNLFDATATHPQWLS